MPIPMIDRTRRGIFLIVLPAVALVIVIISVIANLWDTSEVAPACLGPRAAIEDCWEREVNAFNIVSLQSSGAAFDYNKETPSVEAILEKGLNELELSPTHIVVCGTTQSDSIRCEWHGVARTSDQRENAIRFWLGIDNEEVLPSPTEIEERFMVHVNGMSPRHRPTWRSNVSGLAQGGFNPDTRFLACYATYDLDEYLLGDGNSAITIGYDHLSESQSYDLYVRAHSAGQFDEAPLRSTGEYLADLHETIGVTESRIADILEGNESVVFLAPMGSRGNVAIEVWQVVAQEEINLSGNSLTRGIPVPLENVPTNDLTSLNLVFRAPPRQRISMSEVLERAA